MTNTIPQVTKENQVVFEDQTNDRKYFSIIPNFIFEIGLSANEIAVYCLIKKVAGENGKFYMGVRRTCETLKLNNKTLKKIKETLIEKKLISVEIKSKEEGGQHITRILDIWPENMSHFKKQGGVVKELQGCSKRATGGVVKELRNKNSIKEEHIKKKKEVVQEKVAKAPTTIKFLLVSSRKNVKLTEKEIAALQKKLKEDYDKGIERFSEWLETSGKTRRSHYRAILTWIPDWLTDLKIDEAKKSTRDKFRVFAEKVKSIQSDQNLRIYPTGIYIKNNGGSPFELPFSMPYEDFCRLLANYYGIKNYQGDM